MLEAILNWLSSVWAPIARALDRPHITTEATEGLYFVVGPTDDYSKLRLHIDLPVTLMNRTQVATTVRIRGLNLCGELEIELAALNESGAKRAAGSMGMVDLRGGKTTKVMATFRVLIPNKQSSAFGARVRGKLLLTETYGGKIRPVPFTLRLSGDSPPGP